MYFFTTALVDKLVAKISAKFGKKMEYEIMASPRASLF